jgi:hypothetical protein
MHGGEGKRDLYLDQNLDYQTIKAPAEKVLAEIGEKFVPFREQQDSTPKESKEIIQYLSKRQKEEKPIETVPVEKPNPVQKKELEEKDKYMGEAGKVFPTEYAKDGILSKRVKKAYVNEKDSAEEIKKDLEEEDPTDILANISGLRGDIKPEEPWGGINVEPYFAAKGEPTY